MIVANEEFTTVAQLLDKITKLTHGLDLNSVYVVDVFGDELSKVSLEQATLSDRSVVFNILLSKAADPNS